MIVFLPSEVSSSRLGSESWNHLILLTWSPGTREYWKDKVTVQYSVAFIFLMGGSTSGGLTVRQDSLRVISYNLDESIIAI